MPVRDLFAQSLIKLASSTVTISTATTTAYDFGTPNDINLEAVTSTYDPGDRLLIVFSAVTAGTTDTVSWSVQDADDSSGSIGTPATAVTDGTLTGGKTLQFAWTCARITYQRPWFRVRVTSSGATDTFITTCAVFAVPRTL